MRKYVITTDGGSDLSAEYLNEQGICTIPLYYNMDGQIYGGENAQDPHEFYDLMRQGKMPTTMAANPDVAEKVFRKLVEDGYDILHIGFSSALSGTYNVAAMVANQLMEEMPEVKIIAIDSLAASLGQGLLVYKANELKKAGKTIDEVADWVEANKLHLAHQFTVDDLFNLHRGGRVSKATAIVGSLIQIKPILHVDDEGRLVATGKVRGRKKSLNALVENMATTVGDYLDKNDIIFISHGDCPEEAQVVADKVKERFGIEKFHIGYVNPVIGAHSGPGTMALFYLSEKR